MLAGGAVSRAHLRPPPTSVPSSLHRARLGPEAAGAVATHVCPAAPRCPFPPRCTSGMDSGRDFLTLHGECPAGAPGVPAWPTLQKAVRTPGGRPQLLHPPSAPPRRARPSALLLHWGNLGPGLRVGHARHDPAFPVKFPRSKRRWGVGVPVSRLLRRLSPSPPSLGDFPLSWSRKAGLHGPARTEGLRREGSSVHE